MPERRNPKLPRWAGLGAAVALALGFLVLLSFNANERGPESELVDLFNAPFKAREGAWNRARREAAESFATIGRLGAPFALIDQTGAPRGSEDFTGGPALLVFGATRSGAGVEEALRAMLGALDRLGDPRATPVFVTLDPAEDSIERLGAYAATLDQRLVALTGPPSEIDVLASSYRIAAVRSAPSAPLDHSLYILVLDERGRYRAHLAPPFEPAEMARDIRTALGR